MVLSPRNHGNFSRKVTCFLKSNEKEKPKCQDFSEKIHASSVLFGGNWINLYLCGHGEGRL